MTREELLWILLAIVSIVVAVLRLSLPVSGINFADVYKDLAHVYIGGLYGAAFASVGQARVIIGAMAVALSVLEVVAAIVR